jgi:hypothetical protein
VSILYLGENHVHPLYRVDRNLSMQSIVSILSTLFAPEDQLKIENFKLKIRLGEGVTLRGGEIDLLFSYSPILIVAQT